MKRWLSAGLLVVASLITIGWLTNAVLNTNKIVLGVDKFITCDVFTSTGIVNCIEQLGSEGGEIYLPEGNYSMGTPPNTITFSTHSITLTGAGEGTVLDFSSNQDTLGMDTADMSSCTIRGIKFLGAAGGGGTGEFIGDRDQADTLTIENCWFVNADDGALNLSGDYQRVINNHFENSDGVDINHVTGNYIQIGGNTSFSCAGESILASGSMNAKIIGNTLVSPNVGIKMTNSLNSVIMGNVIQSNAATAAINLDATSSFCSVIGNTIEDSGAAVDDIFIEEDYNTIMGNTCDGTGSTNTAIHLDEADFCIVSGNISSGHDVAGILEDSDCEGNVYYGNYVADTTSYTLNGAAHSSHTIVGTIFLRKYKTGTNQAAAAAAANELWVDSDDQILKLGAP